MYFEIYREGAGSALGGLFGAAAAVTQWRWRLRAANHQIIASGEGYHNKADCLHTVNLLRQTNQFTPVNEL